jgi:hypothetical protein
MLGNPPAGVAQRRLRVELYGGIARIAPDDLNSIPESYESYLRFYYVDRYEYYRNVGYVRDFETKSEGRFRSLRWGFPVGLRVRYSLASFLDVSLGVRGFWGSADSNYALDVRLVDTDGRQSERRQIYDPLKISASGITPLLGLHFKRNIAAGIELEAFLAGGPLIGRIEYSRQVFSEEGQTTPASFLDEKGNSAGVALEAGLRLAKTVHRHLGLFLEMGYAHQVADGFKGEGLSRDNSGEESWEGEWAMKDTYLADYWGTRSLLMASNRWTVEDAPLRRRDFKLDLSGAQVRAGLSVRL